jgi:hypothetical protein
MLGLGDVVGVETELNVLSFELVDVKISNWNHPIVVYLADHTTAMSVVTMAMLQILECLPCLRIDVGHHGMKCMRTTFLNMMECINVSLIHIEVCIC